MSVEVDGETWIIEQTTNKTSERLGRHDIMARQRKGCIAHETTSIIPDITNGYKARTRRQPFEWQARTKYQFSFRP